MEQMQELQFIFSFVDEGCFDARIDCSQLRSLWTAYCLHHDLEVDTSRYDSDLTELWSLIAATGSNTACWDDYEGFGAFMCADLV